MRISDSSSDVCSSALLHRHAAFGIGDDGLEQLGPFKLPVFAVERPPHIDGAGHRDRQRSIRRDAASPEAAAPLLHRQRTLRSSGAVAAAYLRLSVLPPHPLSLPTHAPLCWFPDPTPDSPLLGTSLSITHSL